MNEQPSNPSQTPTPPQEQEPPTVAQHKKEITKRKRTNKAAILLVLTVFLVAAGIVAYFILMEKTKPAAEAEPTTQAAIAKNADTVMEEAKEYIDTTLKDAYPSLTAGADTESNVIYKAGNADSYVLAELSDGIRIVPDPSNTEDEGTEPREDTLTLYGKLDAYLTEGQKLERVDQEAQSQLKLDDYQSESVFCGLIVLSDVINLSCEDKEALDKIAADRKPFADAMQRADELRSTMLLAEPEVTDSSVEGYKKASVSIGTKGQAVGGFAGLFYKKNAEDWKFFKGTQAPLTCEAYNTDDLKKAFAGDKCFNGDKESTVNAKPPKED